jgi:hypothetical protein
MHKAVHRWGGLLGCLAFSHAAVAEDYWDYQYKNIDVLTSEGSNYAVNLAQNLDRFDEALSRILKLNTAYRVAAQVYMLPSERANPITGSRGASYGVDGYSVAVVGSEDRNAARYWGAYFGYAGGLLVSDRAVRYPQWVRMGVPLVFSSPRFARDAVIMGGGMGTLYARFLLSPDWIPMRTFLSLRQGDPQLRDPDYMAHYEAQSWWLARVIFVEQQLRPEFHQYLGLMSNGTAERDAFTASFKIGYDDLDTQLKKLLRAGLHEYRVAIPEVPQTGAAVKLSEATAQGRLALLMLRFGHANEALQLSNEALQHDPANESALRAAARTNLHLHNYEAALSAVDRLRQLPAPSADALTDCGLVLVDLGAAVEKKQVTLPQETAALYQQALEDYRQAMADPNALRAWVGVAELYVAQHDETAAKSFVPQAQQLLERFPRNSNLPRSLARLCIATRQMDCAFQYVEVWRDTALTDGDRSLAETTLSHLKNNPLGVAPTPPPAAQAADGHQ